jgi:hypothetical protein
MTTTTPFSFSDALNSVEGSRTTGRVSVLVNFTPASAALLFFSVRLPQLGMDL